MPGKPLCQRQKAISQKYFLTRIRPGTQTSPGWPGDAGSGVMSKGQNLPFGRRDIGDEALEQIMAVLRTGRGFRMVLDRKDRFAFNLDTFKRTIK